MSGLPAPAWPRAPLLLCASSSRTGPVQGLISLGAFLRARGIDARFAGDRVREGEDLPGHLERAGLPWVPGLGLSRKVRLADLLRDARTLTTWVREGSPDLLHAAFAHDYSLALWAVRRCGKARENLRLVREAHRRVDLAPGRFAIRHALLRRADGIVVRARSYASALITAGLPPARVRAIPGSVDANLFTPGRTEAARALRESWGIPEEAPLFGMVARMKPERLQARVLEAFVSIQHQVPSAHLVFIGRGEDEPRLQAQVRSLASQPIHFGGYQRGPALIEAYRALDVAIWLREGNDGACRGVLEAMACGVPMIVGDDGAPPELVLPEKAAPCGLVVDSLDPKSIAAALVTLANDRGLRDALGQAGRARAIAFTAEKNGEETLRFWREIRALPPVERTG